MLKRRVLLCFFIGEQMKYAHMLIRTTFREGKNYELRERQGRIAGAVSLNKTKWLRLYTQIQNNIDKISILR